MYYENTKWLKIVMEIINLKTHNHDELVDITAEVKNVISRLGIREGAVLVYNPHTTAGLTINENADTSVKSDIIKAMNALNFEKLNFLHAEGNSPSHVKASLFGSSLMLIINNAKPVLGTWQGIFFCEFDGPRNRKVYVNKI